MKNGRLTTGHSQSQSNTWDEFDVVLVRQASLPCKLVRATHLPSMSYCPSSPMELIHRGQLSHVTRKVSDGKADGIYQSTTTHLVKLDGMLVSEHDVALICYSICAAWQCSIVALDFWEGSGESAR